MKTQVFILLLITTLIAGCGRTNNDYVTDGGQGGGGGGVVPPQAANIAYQALGNSPLNVTAAQGVTSNDPVVAPVTQFQNPSAQGGTVAVNADGSFAYTPATGFVGNDTFTYTSTNAAGQSQATVTVTIANLAWYVNNQAAGGGDGSFGTPFTTLAAALAAAGANDTIFVYRGDGTNTGLAGAVALQNGQQLIGEGLGLNFNNGINPRNDDILAQQIVPAGQFPMLTGPITLADGNTVAGLRLEGATGSAITGNGIAGATLDTNQISAPTGDGIQLVDATGTLTITNSTFDNIAGNQGIDIQNTGATILNSTITGNTFTDDGTDPLQAISFDTQGTSQVTATVSNNSSTSPAAPTSWDEGLFVTTQNGSTFDLTANSNNFAGIQNDGFDVQTNGTSQFLGTFDGNTITGPGGNGGIFVSNSSGPLMVMFNNGTLSGTGDDGLEFQTNVAASTNSFNAQGNQLSTIGRSGFNIDANDGTINNSTLDQNTVDGTGLGGIDVTPSNGAQVTTVLSNNSLRNATADAIFVLAIGSSSSGIGIRSNQLDTSGVALTADSNNTATLCLQANGNTASGNTADEYRLGQAGTSVFNVEDFANFAANNVGTLNVTQGTINDVPTCNVP